MPEPLKIFIGFDHREQIASTIAEYSIRVRTKSELDIQFLNHRKLRAMGCFRRPWLIDGKTGGFTDIIDAKPFSTEFSHTRFLVPYLCGYKGWALFMDADMIFQSNIMKLFDLREERFAVMCVKHKHNPPENKIKMDGRLQYQYYRKNWSSFVLWNCGHHLNKSVTPEFVNTSSGSDMHAFSWIADSHMIGSLPSGYNYISGVSPKLGYGENGKQMFPDVIHYTEGGPWFPECQNVPHADLWLDEYASWQEDGHQKHVAMEAVRK